MSLIVHTDSNSALRDVEKIFRTLAVSVCMCQESSCTVCGEGGAGVAKSEVGSLCWQQKGSGHGGWLHRVVYHQMAGSILRGVPNLPQGWCWYQCLYLIPRGSLIIYVSNTAGIGYQKLDPVYTKYWCRMPRVLVSDTYAYPTPTPACCCCCTAATPAGTRPRCCACRLLSTSSSRWCSRTQALTRCLA